MTDFELGTSLVIKPENATGTNTRRWAASSWLHPNCHIFQLLLAYYFIMIIWVELHMSYDCTECCTGLTGVIQLDQLFIVHQWSILLVKLSSVADLIFQTRWQSTSQVTSYTIQVFYRIGIITDCAALLFLIFDAWAYFDQAWHCIKVKTWYDAKALLRTIRFQAGLKSDITLFGI